MRKGDKILYWVPRVLGIIFAAFISIFALDVFGEGYGFWGTIFAFLMHLVPTFLVVGALLAGWRWEWPGGVFFIGLAVFYMVIFRRELDPVIFLLIPGPLSLIGVLFLVNWFRKRTHGKSP